MEMTKVFVMLDARSPIYDLSLNKGLSVWEKELELPLEQLQEYMSIQGKYNAMQEAIGELYNERR